MTCVGATLTYQDMGPVETLSVLAERGARIEITATTVMGDQATVEVFLTTSDGSGTRIDEVTVHLRRENGEWKVCDF